MIRGYEIKRIWKTYEVFWIKDNVDPDRNKLLKCWQGYGLIMTGNRWRKMATHEGW